MHMSDALIIPAVAGTMYVCSAGALAYSIKKIKLEKDETKIPMMGVMGAFVFAAQMINFTIPGTGSSGHIAGGMLLSALLGPWEAFVTMIGVLLIQCLLFADGGLMALGCNIWNMAFYGCFVGGALIWRLMIKKNVTKKRIILASVIGCILTLQMGAFSVVLETTASGITELPFLAFTAVMQPIHLIIGLVEGLVTAAVLCFIYEARPELLWTGKKKTEMKKNKLSYKKTLGILLAVALLIGGALSLVASAFPDGLEWSISQLTGDTEISSGVTMNEAAQKIQDITAVLPDYSFKNSDNIAGTSFSGVLGAIIVLILCIAVSKLVRIFRLKRNGHGYDERENK